MTRTRGVLVRGALVAMLVGLSSSGAASLDHRRALVANAAPAGSVTKTVTATRTHLDGGNDNVVLSKKVSVTVSATTNLRDRQGLDVSWQGAEPTRGIIADSNSSNATQQEYPMVLLQCRGTAAQASPATCWAPTAQERYQFDYGNAFPAWRVDRYADAADRGAFPGEPTPRSTHCPSRPLSEHWLPFLAADGKAYYGGANDCAGLPPDASGLDATLGLPSNATYAATRIDGTGNAQFNVRDATDNASLGCSDKVACVLVIIPIVGISCDVTAAALPPTDQPPPGADADNASTLCHKSGAFKPGEIVANPQKQEDLAVSGALWWSASNWRNRIAVPLSFAIPANTCDLASTKVPSLIYGSELMIQATTQWAPRFCLNAKYTPFKHVQTGEPQARNLLGAKAIQAALTSAPPGSTYHVPTVHAPVALTGFAITYAIDNAKGESYGQLKLTPRLIAKLMTESYPALAAIQRDYTALSHNPVDLSSDPEFIALNPGISQGVPASISASSLFSIASDSDVILALTGYINADAEARDWLDGKPDPWGMVVNPNYKKIALPVDSWPLLDTYEPTALYQPGANDCLHDAPVPYLPLVASPTSRLANVALAMQFAIANSQVVCSQPLQGTSDGQKLVPLGRQTRGFRFMIGLTSLADAERYGLATAALESRSTADPAAKFSDAAGRTFVAPDDASLRAAARLLAPDEASKSWPIRYDALRADASGATAYPGTMLVYADVPTSGLGAADATAFGQLLSFAAGDGQVPGPSIGRLAPGYLPMTAANGMAALAAYTASAATDVTAQNGTVPPLVPGAPRPPPAARSSRTPAAGSSAAGGGGGNPAQSEPAGGPAGTTSRTSAPSVAKSSPAKPAPSAVSAAPVGATVGLRSQLGSIVFILLLALMLVGPVFAPITVYASRRRSRR